MDDISDHIIKILTILPAIFIVLSLHELGHYIVAKFFKVPADEYSLGYGRSIFSSKNTKGTNFVIRTLPIGAHVHLRQKEYEALPTFPKLLIILAGPAFNFLTVFPLFFIFFAFIGQPSTPPVFAGIEIGGVADQSGLKTNDRILKANGKNISRYEEIIELNKNPPIKPISLQIQRDQETYKLIIEPEIISYIDIDGLKQHHGRLGVLARHAPYDLKSITGVNGKTIPNDDRDAARTLILSNLDQYAVLSFKSTDGTIREFKTYLDAELNKDLLDPKKKDYDNFYVGYIGSHFYKKLNPKEALVEAFQQSKDILAAILKIPFQLFPIDKEELKPDETTKNTPVKNWIYKFIFFIAVISVLVGMINLIPLPHFDGGQLILLLSAAITPNALKPKNKSFIIVISLISLYALIAISNYANFKTFTHQKFCNSPEWEKKKEC